MPLFIMVCMHLFGIDSVVHLTADVPTGNGGSIWTTLFKV